MGRLFKLYIIGQARHGKDTFAEMLQKLLGFKIMASSEFAAELFIFDALKDTYGYETWQECFEDRVNHRTEWGDLIADFCAKDKAAFGRKLLEHNDVYIGCRRDDEILAAKEEGLMDEIILVDASIRCEPESPESYKVTITPDRTVTNNDTEEELWEKAHIVALDLLCKWRGKISDQHVEKIHEISLSLAALQLTKFNRPYRW